MPYIKSSAECLQCRWRKEGGRLTTEIKGVHHNMDKKHRVAIHHPESSIYLREDGSGIQLTIAIAIVTERSNDRGDID